MPVCFGNTDAYIYACMQRVYMRIDTYVYACCIFYFFYENGYDRTWTHRYRKYVYVLYIYIFIYLLLYRFICI